MAGTFTNSMRSIAADRSHPWIFWFLLAAILLGLWFVWLIEARISVYEMSESARLEVNVAVYPISASVEGRVVATYMVIGQEVKAGDVLVELESQSEGFRLEEQKAQTATLSLQLNVLYDEIAAEHSNQRHQQQTSLLAVSESRQRIEEAETAARFAQDEADRLLRLHTNGVLSEVDMLRARTEAIKNRAAANALRLETARLESDQKTKDSDTQVRIERLNREIASLSGQMAGSAAAIRRLESDVEKRRIKASIAGRVGELEELRIGAVVNAGQKIGAIIPGGLLKAIAYFRPSALGRIRPDQRAQLRLEGFTWTQYGTVGATVTSIADEPRDGLIRVDLAINPNQAAAIPFQHGLPGTVEIEVERASPATLLLRTIGKSIEVHKADL